MRAKLRTWLRARVGARYPVSVLIDHLTPAEWIVGLLVEPGARAMATDRWRAFTALPGDEWVSFVRDQKATVASVKPSRIELDVTSRIGAHFGAPPQRVTVTGDLLAEGWTSRYRLRW